MNCLRANRRSINKLCGKPCNMPRPCTPHAAAQLQPIHALCLPRPAQLAPWIFITDRQWLTLGGGVNYGVVHINYAVTWTANQSGLVTLTFDLGSGVRVMCDVGYCANFSLPMALCSRVTPDVRNRQTDIRQKHSLVLPPIRGGGKKNVTTEGLCHFLILMTGIKHISTAWVHKTTRYHP